MLAHTTPIHNANMTLTQVVHRENLPMSGCPHEESHTGRGSHNFIESNKVKTKSVHDLLFN
jgi:hypothetical protein